MYNRVLRAYFHLFEIFITDTHLDWQISKVSSFSCRRICISLPLGTNCLTVGSNLTLKIHAGCCPRNDPIIRFVVLHYLSRLINTDDVVVMD